ncbi:NitT/TauT family transport system permease protein [Tamaricihabitans halophyticus]|uniref:NitT/TauT family transport system permease protein n=1 Tax=Tamaricihabitans halophyticus TaxID=1262583 RepID=A0A4R2R6B1_9PSEU|nr:ABC transporter permease [Tamaricihabitans halophyticus]TCP54885.1 NitT/TauT family transport system permease protein [Tamaricihabitans halophyticus]
MPRPEVSGQREQDGPKQDDPKQDDLSAVEAGLDALDAPVHQEPPRRLRTVLFNVLPPIAALVVLILIWQALWASALWPEYKLPAPGEVWAEFWSRASNGEVLSIIWTSVHRAVLGFAIAVAVATPLGLLVAKVPIVRAALGPLITGMQGLPSVAWVPAAVLWFGIEDPALYFVVLLGSIPSITNGLVSGIDQIPPILPRVGKSLGASNLAAVRHILLPAALPGYLSGLKQGWAFSWRSLMAAELIATSPALGLGLGAYLQQGNDLSEMSMVITAIFLILLVGISIELLVFRPLERHVLHSRGLTGAMAK